ncbi:hypothetical protein LCGC14_0469680 [marine sediment metagenome]|uniref:Uncharacterized protein n=1 Tax=marine sediment metagenome TaxID=412755 RepID=A0A0F9VLF7_9ZZZZ
MDEAILDAVGPVDELLDELEGHNEDSFHDHFVDNYKLVHCYGDQYEGRIDGAEIIEVSDSVDLHDILTDTKEKIKAAQNKLSDKVKENKDRAEYEKLKKRFE